MKATFPTNSLLEAITAVSKVIPKNATLPVLEKLYLHVVNNSAILRCTNLEHEISITLPCKSDGEFKILIDDIKKHLGMCDDVCEIESHSEAYVLKSGGESWKFTGSNAEDFPREMVKTFKCDRVTTARVPFVHENIKEAISYSGTDTLRPALSSINFEVSPEKTTVTSTDAHRLVTFEYTSETKSERDVNFMVPASAMKNITWCKKNCNEIADMTFMEELYNDGSVKNQIVVFVYNGFKHTIRCTDGKYPDFRAVIPTARPIQVTADSKALTKCIEKAMLSANKNTNTIMFNISKAMRQDLSLDVIAEDLDYGKEFHGSVPLKSVVIEDSAVEFDVIGFNGKFMLMILKNNKCDVTISMQSANRAILLNEVSEKISGVSKQILIMPVMLND